MRLGTAFSSADASAAPQVSSGGQSFKATRVGFSRSIGGAGLPSEVAGGGSSVAGSVDVDFAPRGHETGVADVVHPWRPVAGLPLPVGALVDAAMGEVQGGTHPVMTGGVVTGDSGDHLGALSATVEDSLADLSTRVSWPYVRSAMPPSQSAPAAYRGELRRVGLTHWAVVDRALRATGNGTGMPDPSPSIPGLVVPFVDTAWPEKGTVYRARSYGDANLQVGFVTDLFTRVLTDGNAVYAPSAPITGSAMCVSMRVATGHAGAARVVMTWAAGTVTVRVTGSRVVEVSGSGGAAMHTVPMGASDTWVHVRVGSDGSSTVRTESINVTGAVSVAAFTAGVTQVEVSAVPGARVGNLIVSALNHFNERVAWAQRTRLYPSSSIPSGLSDMPRQHDVDSLKLLADITSAACLGFWRDAQGIVKVTAPDYLPVQPVRAEITASLLLALGWNRQADAIRRRVVLHRQMPMSGSRLVPTITLWQSSGETLPRGHERVDVVQIPADEDWVVCTETHRIGDPIPSTVWGDPDKGQGTIVGGWLPADNTPPAANNWATPTYLTVTSTSSHSAGLYTFTSTPVSTNLSPGDVVDLATAPIDQPTTTLPTRHRDQPVPILRGWATCQWVEGETYSSNVGPASAPDLVHDTGPWVQLGAQALADYLASRIVPMAGGHGLVTLTQVPVRPDWRLEPGDVVVIRDGSAMQVELTCLITGISASQSAGAQDMSLDLQVLSGLSTLVTYGDVDAANGSRTYGQDDTLVGSATYGQDRTNPLTSRS